MTKIVLFFWVLAQGVGITEPVEIEGWKTMAECEAAAESLTESNPKMQNTYQYALVAQCVEIPK